MAWWIATDTDTWMIVHAEFDRCTFREIVCIRKSERATAQQYTHRQTNGNIEGNDCCECVSENVKFITRIHTITFSRCIFSRWKSQIRTKIRSTWKTVKNNNHHFCGNASGSLGRWHGPLLLYQTPGDWVFVPRIALRSRNVWNLIMMGFCLCLCLLSKFPLCQHSSHFLSFNCRSDVPCSSWCLFLYNFPFAVLLLRMREITSKVSFKCWIRDYRIRITHLKSIFCE